MATGKRPKSEQSVSQWLNNTSKTVAAARCVLANLHNQTKSSEDARNATRADNVSKYKDVHNKLYQKIQNTVKLQKPLEERLHGCRSALIVTQSSLKMLQDSKVAYDIRMKGIMDIKAERAEVWEKHGLGGAGATKDASQVALEEERVVLEQASGKCSANAAQTKVIEQNLKTIIQSLESDFENKSHSLSIDQECMQTTHPTWPLPVIPPKVGPITGSHASNTGSLRPPRSAQETPRKRSSGNRIYSYSGPGGGSYRAPPKHDWRLDNTSAGIGAINPDVTDGPDVEESETHVTVQSNSYQELTYQQETLKLVQRARGAESTAQAMCMANKKLLAKLYRECQDASGFAEVALAKRIRMTQSEVKQLETTLEDTQMLLDKMQHCKAVTADHLASHHEPAQLFQHKVNLRQQRTPRECIGDPVQTAMQIHSMKLVENYQYLEQCQSAEEESIQQLLQAKTVCEADLQHKKTVLDIEKRSLDHMSRVLTEVQKALNRISSSGEEAGQ
eukprot:gnl/MRDRNA2_/MRDRNA2_105875_c0_seq1.p1 gnl/MRDRNA2_/MRDRNA2_105875_c0~~gnl/MRDRNA2_/MRDRNA2_105875_c0_seq1.p1  ORF type:complete len:522 (+),score=106.87 gnl/MRDRNA2_/MRDRNA2_105875_c0_seq1:56-1567(+)